MAESAGSPLSSTDSHDHQFKVLLIGDSGVGKSCIMDRFCEDGFQQTFVQTIGVHCKSRVMEVDEKRVRLQIWDTAGQERFKSITRAYYRGASGVILVYDITNEKSFESIRSWMCDVEDYTSRGVEKMLIGNKCDMGKERDVSEDRGHGLGLEFAMPFMETSAKSGISVEYAFYVLAQNMMLKKEMQRQEEPVPSAGQRVVNLAPSSGQGNRSRKCC